jgi:hypothetical protein
MSDWIRTLRSAFVSGTAASITSTIALALLARAEGKTASQPINATSHWLNRSEAGSFEGIDIAHTAVGYATHHAATLFWAVLFEWWIGRRRPLPILRLFQHALATSAVAVVVDYGATPQRLTPGWELVLTKRSMAVAYGAMAVGLALGAVTLQGRQTRLKQDSGAMLRSLQRLRAG